VRFPERRALLAAARKLAAQGMMPGTSGNVSVRVDEGLLITPSGVPYDLLEPAGLVELDADGVPLGHGRPSTEWRLHRDLLRARPEVGAIVHCHPPFGTALACVRRDIPAFHYMIAVAGGSTIRCATYATFGTAELARNALAALEGRRACLLANHGTVALGATLDAAVRLAVEVEVLAEQYWRALQIGAPVILDDDEMRRVHERFKGYGPGGG
jgi:L-fuculose-phosphate aldolase